MSTPATFGHMNEAGRELLAQPELHSCPLCEDRADLAEVDRASADPRNQTPLPLEDLDALAH